MLADFVSYAPPYLEAQGLSLNLELTNSARLTGQQAPGLGVIDTCYYHLNFYMSLRIHAQVFMQALH